MIDENLKTRWVKALRSGAYRQGRCALVSTKKDVEYGFRASFCCMGVLGHISGIELDRMESMPCLDDVKGIKDPIIGSWDDVNNGPLFDPFNTATHHTLARKLAGLNDSGKGFAEIADWIEQNVGVDHV